MAKGAAGQMPTLMTSRSARGYTPVYAALELIHGHGTDPRSDLYSLGATLYHLLTGELSIVQKTYELILWYVPILNCLPRDHRFALGDRIVSNLYELLEGLILARYARERAAQLESLNGRLDVLRYQSRLLRDFQLVEPKRYHHAAKLIDEVGRELGGWLKQQHKRKEQ